MSTSEAKKKYELKLENNGKESYMSDTWGWTQTIKEISYTFQCTLMDKKEWNST